MKNIEAVLAQASLVTTVITAACRSYVEIRFVEPFKELVNTLSMDDRTHFNKLLSRLTTLFCHQQFSPFNADKTILWCGKTNTPYKGHGIQSRTGFILPNRVIMCKTLLIMYQKTHRSEFS